MRLFLSSYRAGDHTDKLREFIDEGTKIAAITNAKDYKTAEERKESVQDLMSFFADQELAVEELDLRKYFGKKEELQKKLSTYGAVWLAGGNTFLLRHALKTSGADEILVAKVREGSLAYLGESAGAILATPSLEGVQYEDDPDIVEEQYHEDPIFDGLGFVPYAIVPHWGSAWSETDSMVEVLEADGVDYKTLADDQVLIISGDHEEIL